MLPEHDMIGMTNSVDDRDMDIPGDWIVFERRAYATYFAWHPVKLEDTKRWAWWRDVIQVTTFWREKAGRYNTIHYCERRPLEPTPCGNTPHTACWPADYSPYLFH